MALDQDIEAFALDLFNQLWLGNKLIAEPLTLHDAVKPIESLLTEDIIQAVRVRQGLFGESYDAFFCVTDPFDLSATDFYAYLEENFPRTVFETPSTMEKVLTACAFVLEMCLYTYSSYSAKSDMFFSLSYLICAMYIEQEFKSDFYAEGGWWSLIKTCQSYNAPATFLKQHLNFFKASDCKRSIDSYERFTKAFSVMEDPNKDPSLTLLWVDYCIKDLEESASQTAPKILSIKEATRVLNKLKFYCDPSGDDVKIFIDLTDFAMRNGRDPVKLLTAFVQCRPFQRIAGPQVPAAEIFALEQRVKELIKPSTSPGNENQGCDNQKYDELLALFELYNETKRSGIATVGTESHEKVMNKFSKLNSRPPNGAQVLMRTSDDGATHFMRSDSAQARSVGNENFPSNVQTSEVLSSKAAFEYKEDKDLIADFHSQLDLNSTKGVKNSSDHSRSSDGTKKRRSRGKENYPNTHTSDKTYSPKTSSGTSEFLEDKKDNDQITGLLSQLDINSLSTDDSLRHPQISGVRKGRSGEREKFPSNIQISRNASHGRILNGSPSTVKTSESKKDEGFGMISNLDADAFLRDGNSISPKHSKSSDAIRKGSVEEEIFLGFQTSEEDLSQRNKLLKSPNTRMQKHEGQITNEANSIFTANPQDQSSSTSMPAKVEKEKLTDEVINSFSPTDIYSPEFLNVFPSRNVLNTTVSEESEGTDETGRYDLTTVNKDSSRFLDASNTVSMEKSSDPKIVSTYSLNTTCTDVLTRSSSRTSDTVSEEESDELEGIEDCPKTSCSTTPSKNPSRTRLLNASNASVKMKKSKSKTSPAPTPTRRQQLLETEEHAKDILRMIHVLGITTSLEFMKSTLKSNRENS